MADFTLYNADCLDVLKTLGDGSVDAVVTDPPYGIGYSHGAKSGVLAKTTQFVGRKVIGDNKPFNPAPWLAYRHLILWGANHYADELPARSRWLIWDKRDGVNSNDQADCEMAWTNDTRPARLFHHRWMGMLKASERGIPRVHQTQKPVALMEWCLSFLPEGCTVLDPFMGSGTTGVACMNTGRNFIGIEIDPGYHAIAKRRIEEAKAAAESKLFVTANE